MLKRLLFLGICLSFFPKIHFGQELNSFMEKELSWPTYFETKTGSYCEFDGLDFFGKAQYLCTHSNLASAQMIGTNQVWPGAVLNLNLSGANLNKLGMWDGGAIRTTHRELLGRVTNMDSVSRSTHSTQVAGQLIASGINPAAKGMAFQTNLKAWNFSNDNNEIIAAAPGLLLSNHSYGTTAAWQTIGSSIYWYGDSSINMYRDWKFGYYDNRSRIWDSVSFVNPYFLMVKSAGNDRGSYVAPGTTHYYWNGFAWVLTNTTRDTVGPYDCMATFGNAKNILTIGACATDTNFLFNNSVASVFNYSSRGPTDDGRIKPDLVAASGLVYSSTSLNDSDYAYLGGTSMSAPNVTASLLLLQEHHQNLAKKWMKSASLKGLALHTARNCNPQILGPNYDCGWGVPNIPKAALYINQRNKNGIDEILLLNNDTFKIKMRVLSITDTLKASICWTDPKAATGNPAYNDTTLKLINDLDLRLYNQNSIIAYPFILNPNQPALPAVKGDNFRDNFEQILEVGLNPGVYEMAISHKGILQNNVQDFSWLSDVIYEPIKAAFGLSIQSVNNNQITLNFQKGSGEKRLVIAQAGSVANSQVADGTAYLASSIFGNGSSLSNGAFVVYNDTGSNLTISGLNTNQTYTFKVVEYNGNSTQTIYSNRRATTLTTQTLPVAWLSFEGKQISENEVVLNWSTAFEKNAQWFEIQRGSDINQMLVLDSVRAVGNSSIIHKYSFIDSSLNNMPSWTYYRIRQIDEDGKFTFSKVISIQINHPWELDFIYPNPFDNQLTFKFKSTYDQPINLKFFNVLGEIKQEENIDISNKMIIDISTINLVSGIYFLQLKSGEFTKIYRVIRM